MTATILRLGDEKQVNTYTDGLQHTSRVTALADGGWLVTWLSYFQDGATILDVYQQRYDRNGAKVGGENRVNSSEHNSTSQQEQSVTGLADGGWLVTWTSEDQDGSGDGIYQQRYDRDGAKVDGENRVNDNTDNDQQLSSVTALADGGWLVTWASRSLGSSYFDIYQRRYAKNGAQVGNEDLVNTYVTDLQSEPSVTTLADGGWLVTWKSQAQDGSIGTDIYQQRYDRDGAKVKGEQQVNTYVTGIQQAPRVTALADGGWLVTWTSSAQDGSETGIYQQRYNLRGDAIKGEQRVNSETAFGQFEASVTALADGGWLVTWTSNRQDGELLGVYQQRYDRYGAAVGGERLVNSTTALDQHESSVTGLADGGWLVTWTSTLQDGSGSGVVQRRFTPVTAFGTGEEKEHGTGTADDDVFQVRNGGLNAGDSVEAGAGVDTLRMIEAGTIDLTAPALFTGIEIVQGSSGDDIIVSDATRLAGIIGFRGGSGNDALHLKTGDYDFTTKVTSGFEAITLLSAGSIAFADKATALLAHSQTKNGAVILTDDSFTIAERTQLYHQGIRQVTDASGIRVLKEAQASLSTQAVTENAGAGTVVGTLSAIDPTPGDGLHFELIDNAGGRFALSGNQLVVADGSLLDYETGATHRIVVRIVDEGGIATDASFTITLSDVPVEILKGTSGNNVLTGGSGKDVLYGGLGKDTLTGADGQDVFVFDTKPDKTKNVDRITDFVAKVDSIWLDNKVFTKLGKKGTETKPAALKKGYFATDKAKDKDDYLIYNKKTGALSYDADGSGTKSKAVDIALMKKGLSLKASDFFVI